ncbi:FHA domain-containing protein [bacterium]|nr:FHA domain-containing protein [bacterium]
MLEKLSDSELVIEFQICEGRNFIGRADQKPVEVDIEDQEPPDRIWSSRQHALITCEKGTLVIEDLSSANGTYVNRDRVPPGQKRELKANDIVQIGTVQLQVRF